MNREMLWKYMKCLRMFRNKGVLQANFYATVFDETGRPVSRSTSANIYTQPVFFGVGRRWLLVLPVEPASKISFIALDKNERLLPAPRQIVKVIKHEYRTVLTKSGKLFQV